MGCYSWRGRKWDYESMVVISRSFILWRRFILMLILFLLVITMEGGGGGVYYGEGSPLSGTKVPFPWFEPGTPTIDYYYIPSPYDVFNSDLTKLLDVGACINPQEAPNDFSYVPPLDGTDYYHTLCQSQHRMRFVLFDLLLINLAAVDALSGSFTAQLQLVFHWMDAWEQPSDITSIVYAGDVITTADNASLCRFFCDTQSQTACCDGMWVPPLQLPGCKVNDVQSVTPPPYLRWPWPWPEGTSVDVSGKSSRFYVRRKWYVGLDVTCPFTPDFHKFPFDIQVLPIDIINPYASRTWLQLNKGFLKANIIDSISGINLSPDDKIDGWQINDFVVSSACGSQRSWLPTLLTQDYLLQYLGVNYTSQSETINSAFDKLDCAKINSINSDTAMGASLSNPTNLDPYNDTWTAYGERLKYTIAEYERCNMNTNVKFTWNPTIHYNAISSSMPFEIRSFVVLDDNIHRSFDFLDFQYGQEPEDGVNFQCVINAIANLTTPGIRISIVIQRFRVYYVVKLILPICACVAFSFTAYGLKINDLLGRLTVVVPSAIALSALQGFVVATDVPAIAYMAPTTNIVLVSYAVQLVIALECICVKHRPSWKNRWTRWKKWKRSDGTKEGEVHNETELTNLPSDDGNGMKYRQHFGIDYDRDKLGKRHLEIRPDDASQAAPSNNENRKDSTQAETSNKKRKDNAPPRQCHETFDQRFWIVLMFLYIGFVLIWVIVYPLWTSTNAWRKQYPQYEVSLWNKKS